MRNVAGAEARLIAYSRAQSPQLMFDDTPLHVRHHRDERAASHRESVHEPDRIFPGGRVAPQDIGLAIAIVVTRADDAPARVRHAVDERAARAREAAVVAP